MPNWLLWFFAISGMFFWASVVFAATLWLFLWAIDQADAERYPITTVSESYGGTD